MFGQNMGMVIPILTITIIHQVATGIDIIIGITTIGKAFTTQSPIDKAKSRVSNGHAFYLRCTE
jgi:hypothetical protein